MPLTDKAMRAAVIVGTRPEVIKLAPVVRALRDQGRIAPLLIATGQHRELLDSALSAFDLIPDVDLSLMSPDQSLDAFLARALIGLGECFDAKKPDLVIVQGDTTSVLAASLAAFYRRIPIAHVEAGLRTGTLSSPFPEEMNRVLTGRLARWHFAPTEGARDNLRREGIDPASTHVVGNTVIDALLGTSARIDRGDVAPADLGLADGLRTLLVTAHRRENFGAPLAEICTAIAALHDRRPNLQILFPVHLNPNVEAEVRTRLAGRERIILSPPLDYLGFVAAMKRADLILSDSGGVQEEAPSLDTPLLVMRDRSERPEAIAAGAARLVGAQAETIVAEVEALLDDERAYAAMASAPNPFGNGKAATRIAEILSHEIVRIEHAR